MAQIPQTRPQAPAPGGIRNRRRVFVGSTETRACYHANHLTAIGCNGSLDLSFLVEIKAFFFTKFLQGVNSNQEHGGLQVFRWGFISIHWHVTMQNMGAPWVFMSPGRFGHDLGGDSCPSQVGDASLHVFIAVGWVHSGLGSGCHLLNPKSFGDRSNGFLLNATLFNTQGFIWVFVKIRGAWYPCYPLG